MAVRIRDFFRNITTGAGISGRTVSLKRHVDNVEIASTTTGSDGSFTFNDSDFSYRGPTYLTINDGTRYKYHSGKSTGQAGPLWIPDLLASFDNMGVGVINGLAVSASGASMNVSVAAGAAILKDGIPYTYSSAQSATVTTSNPTNPRIDSIVIRGTRLGQTEEGNAVLTIVPGTPAGSPVAPTLTQSSATWDIWLADIRVDAGVTVIASNKVTDRRIFSTHLLPAVGATNDILTVVGGQWVPQAASVVTSTITIKNNDVALSSAINTTDFSSAFSASISPSNEANIGLATSGVASINIAPAAVTTAKLATGAVTSNELGALAVTTAKIASGAVTTTELGALAVTTTKIAAAAVTATELAADAVTGTKLLDSAVTTTKIADLNVTNAKVATGIDAVKIGSGTVSNTEFGFLDGVTSAIQTQIGTKFNSAGGSITGGTTITTGGLAGPGGVSISSGGITASGTTNAITGTTTMTGTVAITGTASLGTLGNYTHTYGPLWFGGDNFTVAVGSAAGTGGSLAASRLRGTENAGEFQVVTGSSGWAGLATVSFANTRPDANYIVVFTPTSTAAGPLQFGLTARTTAGFDVRISTAPSTGATIQCAFIVVQVNVP